MYKILHIPSGEYLLKHVSLYEFVDREFSDKQEAHKELNLFLTHWESSTLYMLEDVAIFGNVDANFLNPYYVKAEFEIIEV